METILITGTTGMLGQKFVNHFLDKGLNVVAIYRNEEKFNKIYSNKSNDAKDAENANLYANHYANLYGICADFCNENFADEIIKKLETINIFPEYLVNVASGCDSFKINSEGFSERKNMLGTYLVDVVAPYELSFKLANHKNSKLKKIVNISSMYGVVPYNPCLYNNPSTETPIQYAVTKAAVIHLTKELAIRFADKNITVNCISYGGVEGKASDEFKEKLAKVTPLKRMMTPDETVKSLDFLISENSVYMTGHNLIVDGGRTIW